jgi:hypothetical protein
MVTIPNLKTVYVKLSKRISAVKESTKPGTRYARYAKRVCHMRFLTNNAGSERRARHIRKVRVVMPPLTQRTTSLSNQLITDSNDGLVTKKIHSMKA